MKRFEGQGHWWLIGREENKVPGTLKIDDSGGAEIHLIGTLRSFDELGVKTTKDGVTTTSFTEESMEKSGTYPRIHGLIGITEYTLEDCFQKRANRNLMGGVPTEVIYVNQVFRNVFYEDAEETEATGISLIPRHLGYWVRKGGLTTQMQSAPRDPLSTEALFSVFGHAIPSDDLILPDGTSVHLRQSLRLTGDGIASKTVAQDFYFRYDSPNLLHMKDLLEVASDLQDLVSIATHRTAAFDEVNFFHPDIKINPSDADSPLKPIEFYARWSAKAEGPEDPPLVLVFGFNTLGGMKGLAKWLVVASQHRKALGRVMGTRYAKSMPLSDRLLNRAAALESFDRDKNGDGINFRSRMARCANFAGSTFMRMTKERKKWAKLVKEDRDDIAHNLGRNRESSEQYFLSESLYWLFILCMLKECGAPRAVFKEIEESQEFSWLCTKVSAMVKTS